MPMAARRRRWSGSEGRATTWSSPPPRAGKDRNIRRDPRVSLTVYDRNDPQRYAEIRGLATVTDDIGRALAVRLEEEYEGPGAGQVFLDLPPEVVRMVVRITPQRVAGRAAG